jgi:hypothetical protein
MVTMYLDAEARVPETVLGHPVELIEQTIAPVYDSWWQWLVRKPSAWTIRWMFIIRPEE